MQELHDAAARERRAALQAARAVLAARRIDITCAYLDDDPALAVARPAPDHDQAGREQSRSRSRTA